MGDSFRNGRLRWVVLLLTVLLFFCVAWTSEAQFVEGFESGDFSALPWVATGDAYWRITDENPIAGSYSAYARGTGSGLSGDASIEFVAYAEAISFRVEAVCRALGSQFDLRFYVDGQRLLTIDSNGSYTRSYTLEPGVHSFRWRWDGSRWLTWSTYARLDAITLTADGVYEDFNGDSLVDMFQDFNADGVIDVYEDHNGNGVADGLDDYDRNGMPDAIEDTDSNGIPDALQDLNDNDMADGFEDEDDNDLYDFFEDRFLVTSSSHPNAARWYFDTTFECNWERLYPSQNGYLYVLDQTPDTVVDLFNGEYMTAYTLTYPDLTHGTWYLHIVAVDANDELIEDSRERFQFNVNTAAPTLTSTSHPDSATGQNRSDFVVDAAWPAEVATGSVVGYYYLVNLYPDTTPTSANEFSDAAHIEVPGNPLGTNWFHAVAVDRLGNLSQPAHYSFIVLGFVPVITSPTHPDQDKAYPGRDVTFEWTVPPKGVIGYRYVFDKFPGTVPTVASTYTTAQTITFTNVAAGVSYFHLRSVDEFGVLSPTIHFKVTIISQNAPSLSSTTHPNPDVNYDLRNVQFVWEDPDGLAVGYYFVFDERNDTVPTVLSTYTTSTSRNFLGVSEGYHYFHICSIDAYGNLSPTAHLRVNVVSGSPLTLSTSIVGQGSTESSLDNFMYTAGVEVELTAVPERGWGFDHWSGDLSGSDNPITFTMEDDMNVTAVFVEVFEPEDVNLDHSLNALDVQLCINAALGFDVEGLDADVNDDGSVDAVDIQATINAVLNA